MWTLIIVLIISLGIAIYLQYKNGFYNDFEDYLFASIGGLFIGFIIAFSIAVILPVKYQKEVNEFEIVTLQDNSQTTGRFFLGSGFINGTMKYVFYYKSGDSYMMHMVDYSSAEIIMTDKNPYIRQISYEKSNDFINKFAVDFESPDTEFIFYVPKGTIKSNYSLDAL